jgi:ABC-type multidrug transport system fused ATPase/permease subunit
VHHLAKPDRLQRLSLAYYDKTPSGPILSKIMDDGRAIQVFITSQTFTILTDQIWAHVHHCLALSLLGAALRLECRFEAGLIAEEATHEELMELEAHYAATYLQQSKALATLDHVDDSMFFVVKKNF